MVTAVSILSTEYTLIILGGHTKAASYRSFLDNTSALGLSEAIKIAKLEYENIKSVHAFVRMFKIDCDLYSGDTVDIIYDQAQWDTALKAVQAMRDAMPEELDTVARYRFWSAAEARYVFHCKGEEIIGAISYEAGSLSAYKFVIGVLKLCLKSGLGLFTNTPVMKLTQGQDKTWEVLTAKGIIKARNVVLATNGYTGFLHEKFRGSIVPLRGQITAQRPGLNMPAEGLQTTYSFIYSGGYEYMIPQRPGTKYTGDIIIGGGLVKAPNEGLSEYGTTDDTSINEYISTYLRTTTPRYFGSSWGEDHPDGRIRSEWTGIMGYSPDGFPFVGEMPGEKGLWVAAGFQGHGMVLCYMCVRALGSLMGGEDQHLWKWFPRAWLVTEERLRMTFKGRLHVNPAREEEIWV